MQRATRVRFGLPRRWVGVLAAVLGSAAVMSGCSVAADPQTVTPSVYVEQPTLSSAAAAKGADAARDAAAWAQRFVLAHSFDKRFMDPQRQYTEADFVSAMQGSLSEDAMTHWQAEAASAVAGDELARDQLNVLTYVAPANDPLTLPSEGEPVRSQQVTDVKVSVDPQTELFTVSLHYGAQLQLQEQRKPVILDATKIMQLTLSPVVPAVSATSSTPATSSAAPSTTTTPTSPASGAWVIEQYEGSLTLEPQ